LHTVAEPLPGEPMGGVWCSAPKTYP